MTSLVHVQGVEGSKRGWTLLAGVGEGVGEVPALYVVAHIAEAVVAEVATDTTGWLPRLATSGHIHVEVFWLCDWTYEIRNDNINIK